MIAGSVMGIIFTNTHDSLIRELTELRSMGSVPFGGRYRLIDFSLSNLVNAGVNRVGVITKSNYQSLLDHLGSGKPWDLARKKDGLFILPPYGSAAAAGIYEGRVDALAGVMKFLQHSTQDYVVMCDADVVGNIDLEEIIDAHIEGGADVTIACKKGDYPRGLGDILSIEKNRSGRITDIRISPFPEKSGLYSLDIFVLGRKFLIQQIQEAMSRGRKYFAKDVLLSGLGRFKMRAFEVKTFTAVIDGMKSYLDASMALLDSKIRGQLFDVGRPIYTKVRDDMPARYGLGCRVENCIVADGCVIEGEVENSILFRGVRIAKNAVVKNSILMQDTVVEESAKLSYVITDKNVIIGSGRSLMGFETYPVFISKDSKV